MASGAFFVPGGLHHKREHMSVKAVGTAVIAVAEGHAVEFKTLGQIGLWAISQLGAQGPGMNVRHIKIRGRIGGANLMLAQRCKVAGALLSVVSQGRGQGPTGV